MEFDHDGFFPVGGVAARGRLDEETPVGKVGGGTPRARVDESAEFEIQIDDFAPPALGPDVFSQSALPALSPDLALLPVPEAIERARRLFADGDPGLGMAVLEAARLQAPDDTHVATWLEYGERRLITRFCPDGRPERIPVLLVPAERLLAVTAGDQQILVAAIDGRRSLAQIRQALPQVPVVGFWKDLGKLVARGWLGWLDVSG